ncbi:MAG: hypothetical protein VKN33_05610 [Candidatus Sericytochromatia bacterium]|nr:hypothetical protein [Candidatus Sericytochromatia bacterium]
MHYQRLADLRSYRLPAETVDCRGWRVYDCHGVHAGFIEDLIVEMHTGCVKDAILHLDGEDHLLPHSQLQLDCNAQRVYLSQSRETLKRAPTIAGWHPVDRHRVRETLFPQLATMDDWGEVELEDIRAAEKPQRGDI